jgi:hypothetical protein
MVFVHYFSGNQLSETEITADSVAQLKKKISANGAAIRLARDGIELKETDLLNSKDSVLLVYINTEINPFNEYRRVQRTCIQRDKIAADDKKWIAAWLQL